MDYKSILGYSKNSPYANEPFLDINSPEGLIDMAHTPINLIGIDEYGNKKKMKAGRKNPYKFEGQTIREIPMQRGGINDLLSYLFEEDKDEEDSKVTAPSTEEVDNAHQEQTDNTDDEQYNMALEMAMKIEGNPYASKEDDEEIPVTAVGNPYKPNAITNLNPDNYLSAIFGNEAGQTGQKTSLKGSATGRYQIIEGTRKQLYNKYYAGRMSYDQFNTNYKTNPQFEYDVARKLALENIQASKSPAEAIGRWYSPVHAAAGEWNVVPRPDYGNKLTVGQYVNRALKNIK